MANAQSVTCQKVPIRHKDKKGGEAFSFNILDALQSPIITFSQSWADTIPKRILDIIPMARMMSLMHKRNEATEPEIVAYFYTRTLEAPMHGDWRDTYCYISCKVLQEWFNEDHWGEICVSRELSSYKKSELQRLSQWIYDKRRNVLKQRLKGQSVTH